jgi:hypothetical protein
MDSEFFPYSFDALIIFPSAIKMFPSFLFMKPFKMIRDSRISVPVCGLNGGMNG